MGTDPSLVNKMLERIKHNRGATPVLREVGKKAKGSTVPRETGMNKVESRYSHHLTAEKMAGRITDYKYESCKLRLADNTTLTMDFMVIDCDGFVQFHDTKVVWRKTSKPHAEDDFMVKVKVAAEQYPYFEFRMVWEEEGVWKQRIF